MAENSFVEQVSVRKRQGRLIQQVNKIWKGHFSGMSLGVLLRSAKLSDGPLSVTPINPNGRLDESNKGPFRPRWHMRKHKSNMDPRRSLMDHGRPYQPLETTLVLLLVKHISTLQDKYLSKCISTSAISSRQFRALFLDTCPFGEFFAPIFLPIYCT